MDKLLKAVLDAYGGLQNWAKVTNITCSYVNWWPVLGRQELA